jgi:hypothetical protein
MAFLRGLAAGSLAAMMMIRIYEAAVEGDTDL